MHTRAHTTCTRICTRTRTHALIMSGVDRKVVHAVHTRAHTYKHTHIHTYTHTHKHIHTHTHIYTHHAFKRSTWSFFLAVSRRSPFPPLSASPPPLLLSNTRALSLAGAIALSVTCVSVSYSRLLSLVLLQDSKSWCIWQISKQILWRAILQMWINYLTRSTCIIANLSFAFCQVLVRESIVWGEMGGWGRVPFSRI